MVAPYDDGNRHSLQLRHRFDDLPVLDRPNVVVELVLKQLEVPYFILLPVEVVGMNMTALCRFLSCAKKSMTLDCSIDIVRPHDVTFVVQSLRAELTVRLPRFQPYGGQNRMVVSDDGTWSCSWTPASATIGPAVR